MRWPQLHLMAGFTLMTSTSNINCDPGPGRADFERLAGEHFEVAGEVELEGATRHLYHLTP